MLYGNYTETGKNPRRVKAQLWTRYKRYTYTFRKKEHRVLIDMEQLILEAIDHQKGKSKSD